MEQKTYCAQFQYRKYILVRGNNLSHGCVKAMTTSKILLKNLFSILFRWYKTKFFLNRVHSHITSFQYFGKYIFGRTQPSIFLRKGFSHSASALSQKNLRLCTKASNLYFPQPLKNHVMYYQYITGFSTALFVYKSKVL